MKTKTLNEMKIDELREEAKKLNVNVKNMKKMRLSKL